MNLEGSKLLIEFILLITIKKRDKKVEFGSLVT